MFCHSTMAWRIFFPLSEVSLFKTFISTIMFIIGIAGGTGSGKTTVVKKIMNRLPKGEVGIISQDNYYKDSSHVPAEQRQTSTSTSLLHLIGNCCLSI